jgi:hypothetical protein
MMTAATVLRRLSRIELPWFDELIPVFSGWGGLTNRRQLDPLIAGWLRETRCAVLDMESPTAPRDTHRGATQLMG